METPETAPTKQMANIYGPQSVSLALEEFACVFTKTLGQGD